MWASRFRARSPAAVGLVIRFLFIGSRLCSTLLSDPASRRRPCASLSLLLHQDGKRTFTSKLLNLLGTHKRGEVLSTSPFRNTVTETTDYIRRRRTTPAAATRPEPSIIRLDGSGTPPVAYTPLENVGNTPSLFAFVKFAPKNELFQYCWPLTWVPMLFRPNVLLLNWLAAPFRSVGTTANQ